MLSSLSFALLVVAAGSSVSHVGAFVVPAPTFARRAHSPTLSSTADETVLEGLIRVDKNAQYTALIDLSDTTTLEITPKGLLVKEGSKEAGFDVTAAGPGSLTGLSYTVPARTEGRIQAKLKMSALTSQNVKELADAWKNLLSSSQQEKYESYVKTDTTASANLRWLGFFTGAGKAKTSIQAAASHMKSLGLTQDQIDKMADLLYKMATEMSKVKIDFTVYNRDNDFDVSGNLLLYVMAGSVKTSKGTKQYQMLSDGGIAGEGKEQAPASGGIDLY